MPAIYLPILTIDYHDARVSKRRIVNMEEHQTPFICHLFICSNSRDSDRTSCGRAAVEDLKAALKDEIKDRGWKGRVRATSSGCLGVCDMGPNIMIYPQKILFSGVSPNDLGEILQKVEEIIASEQSDSQR
jgi:(2Fe-2S) ferredoxin